MKSGRSTAHRRAGERNRRRRAGAGSQPAADAAGGRGAPMLQRGDLFTRFATSAARVAGKPRAFAAAAAVIVFWAVSGPLFGFSDTWQLIINTSTTIITFLMVFLIQNSQNRESEAVQIKLDELIRALKGAHNSLLDLEEMTAEDLDKVRDQYEKLAKEARRELRNGKPDTRSPEVD
jgi:low affinity Fe/Cu permease